MKHSGMFVNFDGLGGRESCCQLPVVDSLCTKLITLGEVGDGRDR